MKSFLVEVQKEHGPNANPINHRQKWVVAEISEETAKAAIERLAQGRKVIRMTEVIPFSAMCIVA